MISFVERIVNSYMAKIVSNLGYFFEANTGIRFVKVSTLSLMSTWIPGINLLSLLQGYRCKTGLLSTCFKNNDRMSSLIEKVLRKPFNITATPPPKLSLYLKINNLAGWYNNALEDDMANHVKNVIQVPELGV
jgi:hypothetical protein